jgi:hypothetical protein
MNKNKAQNRGPGRPQYQIKWPKGKFTFTDLETENGVNPNTGKGKECTTLTLRKGLKRDLAKRNRSEIVILKGVLAEPNSKNGLGRKQLVYARRVVADKFEAKAKSVAPAKDKAKSKPAPEVSTATPVDAVSKDTTDYEAQKAALLATTPAVTITPAPEAKHAEAEVATAPTAEPVTA